MSNLLLTALLLLVLCPTAGSQNRAKPSHDSKVERELMRLERDWSQAYITHDTTTAERIIAADYVGIDGRGIITNKAQEIEDVQGPKPGAPTPPFLTVAESVVDMQVRVYGDVAVVNGRVIEQVRTKDREIEVQYRRTTVWVMRHERWQCVSFHGSRILDPPKS